MRKTLLVCSLVLLVFNLMLPVNTIVAQETKKITQKHPDPVSSLKNDDVLKMVKTGLSADIVTAKIKASTCKFDTTPDALQKLKTSNVPESVILAMVQAPFGVAGNAVAVLEGAGTRTEVTIPDGTPMAVELLSAVSSNTAKEGDIVDFVILYPVIVSGVIVIEKNAPAKGRIVRVKKTRYWGRAGRVGWAMQDVLLVDGNRTHLRMEKKLTGDSKGGTVLAGSLVTALVFWPAVPFWGLKKGKDAVYPVGTRFEAYVHGDVVMTLKPVAAQSQNVNEQRNSQFTAPVTP